MPCTRGKNKTTVRKQFPIQLACARTIHRAQGLTLDRLAFDPSNIRTHGLVYTTLSRVRSMNSLFLLQKLTQENFHVNKKIAEEMKQLIANGLWKVDNVQKSISTRNKLSIASLNTRSLQAHLDDILGDEDLMNSMILCFQETRTNCPPSKKQFSKFNFNTGHYVHGLLSCIQENIGIVETIFFWKDKVELLMSEVYAQRHVCIMNIYVAPFASLSNVIETISIAKS